jgi:hypothetical protein
MIQNNNAKHEAAQKSIHGIHNQSTLKSVKQHPKSKYDSWKLPMVR